MLNIFQIITRLILRKREFVSDASKDIAQVFFGVFAVESLTKNIVNWNMVLYGLSISTVWWCVGIISFKTKQ